MNKGLEALEIIGNINLGNNPYCALEHDKLKNCINEEYDIIEKDLKRLEVLEKENQELKEENNKLEKALDKACERLDWECPVSQELIDDLDCENCKDTYKECWKKYFLKEVLGE